MAKRYSAALPEFFINRTASKRPAKVPVVTPNANGANVPCQSPCPQAGEDGQKNSSPGRIPVPYNAANMRVTIERWVCFTAVGNSRVVPEVYWKAARSSARVVV